jgi:hypothetical protein
MARHTAAARAPDHFHKFFRGGLSHSRFLHTQENYLRSWGFLGRNKLRFPRLRPKCRVIRDQNIRLKLTDFAQTLRGVSGLANHINVSLVFQQSPQTLTQQDMIVHEHTAKCFAGENYFPWICAWGHTVPP